VVSSGNTKSPNIPKGERLQDQPDWAGFFYHEELFSCYNNFLPIFQWTHGKGGANVLWCICSSSNAMNVWQTPLMALEVGWVVTRESFARSVLEQLHSEQKL
jgi:hypothetical protein